MKKTILISVISLTLSCMLYVLPSTSEASYRCRWISGHYHHGYWVPGHRVCWRGWHRWHRHHWRRW